MRPLNLILCFTIAFLTFSDSVQARKVQKVKKAVAKKVIKRANETSDIRFLTLKELGKLNHWSRVDYVMELRRTILDLEKIQNRFGASVAFKTDPKFRNFVFLFFYGQPANADENKFNRGSGDGCIYGGHYQQYPDGTTEGTGKCIRPSCTSEAQTAMWGAVRKPSNYVLCNFSVFGVQACVSPGRNSTVLCNEEAKKFTDGNSPQHDKAVAFLKSDKFKQWQELPLDKKNEMIPEIKKHAGHPEVMAHLIKLAAEYGSDKLPSSMSEFKEFDFKQAGVAALFKDFKDHCNKELSDSTIASIEKETTSRGQTRKQLLSSMKEKGIKPTVGNVLQKVECEVLLGAYDVDKKSFPEAGGRYGEIKKAYGDIAASHPDSALAATVRTDDDGQPQDTDGTARDDSSSGVVFDDLSAGAVLDVTIDSLASGDFSMNVRGDVVQSIPTSCQKSDEVIQERSMQCMACIAEDSLKQAGQNYKVSQRWLSLVSTMIRYCYGEKEKMSLPSRKVMELTMNTIQTLGHCSASDYNWPSGDKFDAGLVKQWQKGENIEDAKTRVFSFKPDKFKDAYGISLSDANYLFCKTEPSKLGFFKITAFDDYYDEKEKRAMAQRRWSFIQNAGVLGDRADSGTPRKDRVGSSIEQMGPLGKCIMAAKDNGSMASTTNNSQTCHGIHEARKPSSVNAIKANGLAGKPMIAFDDKGECYVSKSTRVYKDGTAQVEFVDPTSLTNPAAFYMVKTDNKSYWDTQQGSASGGRNEFKYVTFGSTSSDPSKSYCPDERGRRHYHIPADPNSKRKTNSWDVDRGSR